MEKYPVPQFIEREAKLALFISFKQFFYLIIAGIICFILYFILSFALFIISALFIGTAALSLAFLKIQGQPVTVVLLNSIGFLIGTKDYTWKKKENLYPFKIIKRVKIEKKEDKEKPGLKIAQESKLKKLRTQVELRTK